jgi:hypothetical protein
MALPLNRAEGLGTKRASCIARELRVENENIGNLFWVRKDLRP